MSSLFKGLSEYAQAGKQLPVAPPGKNEVFTAHVLEVVKDANSPFYSKELGDSCIGSIKIKVISWQYNKPEDLHYYRAFPLDRGDYRLPLPGEAVICTLAYGFSETGAATGYRPVIHYMGVVSIDQQTVSNIAPFLSSDAYHIDSKFMGVLSILNADAAIFAKRFDGRSDFPTDVYKKNIGLAKVRPGETILEGRFGGLIRMSNTFGTGFDQQWNLESQITNIGKNSIATDPLMVIKAHRRPIKDDSSILGNLFNSVRLSNDLTMRDYLDDDINFDDANVYLTTTQNVPMVVNTSQRLMSWDFNPSIEKLTQETDKASVTLAKSFGGGYNQSASIDVKVTGMLTLEGEFQYSDTVSTGAATLGDEADFWTLLVVCSYEDGDPQGRADVAQSIYNRTGAGKAGKASYGKSIAEVCKKHYQYEPFFSAGHYSGADPKGTIAGPFKAIADRQTAIAARKYHDEVVKKNTPQPDDYHLQKLKEVYDALKDSTLNANSKNWLQGRADFLAYYSHPTDIERSNNDNAFGWHYNYKETINYDWPGAAWFEQYGKPVGW